METIFLNKEEELKSRNRWLTEQLVWMRRELNYHEKFLLNTDGHKCEICSAVRHIDDCEKVGEFYACSERCAGRLESDVRALEEQEKDTDYSYNNR